MRLPPFFNSIRSFIVKVLPWVVFVCLAAAMLFDPGRNTLGVASAAFAVTLALASVTFSYARTLKDGSAFRDELVFAGERLVSGAVLFLVASIVKHASNDIPRYVNGLLHALPQPEKQPPDVTFFGQDPIGIPIAFTAFIFFLIGLIYVQMGIVILISIVAYRAKRRPGHDNFFVANKSYEQYLANLEKKEGGTPSNQQSPDRPSTPANLPRQAP
jgi:hypothetical protein